MIHKKLSAGLWLCKIGEMGCKRWSFGFYLNLFETAILYEHTLSSDLYIDISIELITQNTIQLQEPPLVALPDLGVSVEGGEWGKEDGQELTGVVVYEVISNLWVVRLFPS